MSVATAPDVHAADRPAPSSAGAAELDTVFLKDGGLVRGVIIELLPDRSLTIRADADGQTRTFSWDQVAGTSLAAPCPEAAPLGERDRPRLSVTLESPATVHLNELVAYSRTRERSALGLDLDLDLERTRYRIVCTAPCDTILHADAGQRFFFGGEDGVPRSRIFSLTGTGPRVHATVRPGRQSRLTAGAVATPIGAASVVVGIVNLSINRDMDQLLVPGILLVSLGSALLATGAAMLLTARTRVRLTRLRR